MIASQFLTETNVKYWNYINKSFNITVRTKQIYHIEVSVSNKQVKINIPSTGCTKELFTTEILRLYLVSKNVYITDYLIVRASYEPLLEWVFPESFFTWIGIQLESIKIISLLKTAGYNISSLANEMCPPTFSAPLISQLITGMKNKWPSGHSAGLFINRFFALTIAIMFYDDPYNHMIELQQLRSDLYGLLDKLIHSWNHYEINEECECDPIYKVFANNFIQDLGKWCLYNIHCKEPKLAYC